MPDIEDLIRQLREYVGPLTAMKLANQAADALEGQEERIAFLEAVLATERANNHAEEADS